MARCRCGASVCTCALVPGDNIVMTGTGAADDPWVIRAQPSAVGTIAVQDTPTLDLTMTGGGTQANPFIISGTVVPEPGPAGPGVPPGGDPNQILAKLSPADFDTQWLDAPAAANGLPPAGDVGQMLVKTDVVDYAAGWTAVPVGLPPGGAEGDVLVRDSSGEATWRNALWNLPWGVQGVATITAPQSGFATSTVLTGSLISFTAPGGRRYKATFTGTPLITDPNGIMQYRIRRASNQFNHRNIGPGVVNQRGVITFFGIDEPPAGPVNYDVACIIVQSPAAGTFTNDADAQCKTLYVIEDIGPITPI